mmetsp:Transcript_47397/g.78637  ORF Transcript_47397/g.78637 Transcript_47397/m.78637 type:complete len:126 (+) Transcript_47397:1-378(+)
MNYWAGLFAMLFIPCPTLWLTHLSTDLNPRLGGEKESCLGSGCSALCCACCLIAKDAQILDTVTGVKTGLMGVEEQSPASTAPAQQGWPDQHSGGSQESPATRAEAQEPGWHQGPLQSEAPTENF